MWNETSSISPGHTTICKALCCVGHISVFIFKVILQNIYIYSILKAKGLTSAVFKPQKPLTMSEGRGGTWGLDLSSLSRSFLFLCNDKDKFQNFVILYVKIVLMKSLCTWINPKSKQPTSAGFGGGLGCEQRRKHECKTWEHSTDCPLCLPTEGLGWLWKCLEVSGSVWKCMEVYGSVNCLKLKSGWLELVDS